MMAAVANSSSQDEAPLRKLKCEVTCSSAYAGPLIRRFVQEPSLRAGQGILAIAGAIDPVALTRIVLETEMVGDHAGDELVAKGGNAACELEGRHALPELVGLARRETAHGDTHGLLLKQGHASVLPRSLLQFRLWIDNRLKPFAAPQIGMDHAALDGAWPHDRHLDHQIVKGSGV